MVAAKGVMNLTAPGLLEEAVTVNIMVPLVTIKIIKPLLLMRNRIGSGVGQRVQILVRVPAQFPLLRMPNPHSIRLFVQFRYW
mmetsp:Transcript_18813/g.22949  ORF Transcript_18813/g.22949 Transcript_18813/m.22949 type:complete len:83 (+) Transcript_18813:461-709(+)